MNKIHKNEFEVCFKIRVFQELIVKGYPMSGTNLTEAEQKVLEIVDELIKQNQLIRIKELFALAKRKLKFPDIEVEQAVWSLISKKYITDGTKLSKTTVLENFNRQEILKYIFDNPGANIRAVRSKMSMGAYLTSWHLKILEKFGYIRKKPHKNMFLIFPYILKEEDEDAFLVLKDDKVIEVNEYLFEQESITIENLMEKFGLDQPDAQSYLNILSGVDLVNSKEVEENIVYTGNFARLKPILDYWQVKDEELEKILPKVTPAPPPKAPTPIEPEKVVEVKREYDYLGGNIRFKIAVRNHSKTIVSKIRVMLTPTDQFKYESEVKAVDNLGPGESRGVDFLLTPMTCGKSMVYGTVSYMDAYGKPNSLTVNPKEIWVKCPLVTSVKAELKDLLDWQASLQSGMASLSFEQLTKTNAFELVTNQISALDLAVVTFDDEQFKAIYSGIAKVTSTKMIVEVETYEDTIKLVVWASSLNQVTGFLAYIKNLIVVSLEMAKGIKVKEEKFSQQILSAFEFSDRLIQLFEYCEANWNLSDVIILLKEIVSRAQRDLPSLPLELGNWISELEQKLEPEAVLWDQSAINLELETMRDLEKVSDLIRSNLEMYKAAFQEDIQNIRNIEDRYQELLYTIRDIEKKYSKRILIYLLIIDSNSGITLYEHGFADKDLDPDLVSGFLTAVQSFGVELTSDQEAGMKKLAYKNFEIEMNVGDRIRAALFLIGESTKYLIKAVVELINKFEQTYEDALKDWHGDITQFENASGIVKKIFE